MAVTRLSDAQIFLGPWNVSGLHNQVSVEGTAEMLDSTVFGPGATRINTAGLMSWSVSASGFWESGTEPNQLADPNFFNRIGAVECPLTVAPNPDDGGLAYFLKVVQADYSIFGAVGELAPFSLSHQQSSYMTRGKIALPPTQKLIAGSGTAIDLGLVSTTENLTAVMHVVQFDGTTMTMVIESDDNGSFTTPTTRLTLTAATGVTSQWKNLLGPITDNYFRAKWTFTGTSFTALVAIGVTAASAPVASQSPSASLSPSASVSLSVSPSASLSPSASISPSASPSASV